MKQLQLMLLKAKIGRKQILKKIVLVVKPGQTYALLGTNGSGKSTLLNTITSHPDISYEASIQFEEPLFMGFQKPVEIPELLAISLLLKLEEVSTGDQLTKDEFYDKYIDLLERLSITGEMLERPLNTQVSGGEAKRIEILQMLILKPRTILLDEIDTGLDLDAQILIGSVIQDYIKKYKPVTIVVTHNMSFLKYFNITKAIVLQDGEIIAEGKSELIKQIEQKGFASVHKSK